MSIAKALNNERIVAIGLLTKRDLSLLGPTFDRVWPLEDGSDFEGLIRAIDDAEMAVEETRSHGD